MSSDITYDALVLLVKDLERRVSELEDKIETVKVDPINYRDWIDQLTDDYMG